jgi:Flp pilus assembly protein TadG
LCNPKPLAQQVHPSPDVLKQHLLRRARRWLRDTSGANLVEAAIITPVMVFMTFAIVDFALVFYAYLALESGVSQATRYAVTGQQIAGQTREQSIMTAMRNATPTLTIADAAFTFSHLPVGGNNWLAGVGVENEIGKVTVDYSWTLLTPLIQPLFPGGRINIRVESAMKNERRFN